MVSYIICKSCTLIAYKSSIRAKDIMNPNPKMIEADILASEALNTMQKNNISHLLVMKNDEFIGIVHLHNILNEGIS